MSGTEEAACDSPSSLRRIGTFVGWALAFFVMIISIGNAANIVLAMIYDTSLLFDPFLLVWLGISIGLFIITLYLQVWLSAGIWPDARKLAAKLDSPVKKRKANIIVIGMFAYLTLYLILGFLVMPYLKESFLLQSLALFGLVAGPLWLGMEYNRIMYDIEPGPYRKLVNSLLAMGAVAAILILLVFIHPVLAIAALPGCMALFLYLEYCQSSILFREIWK